MMIRKQKFTMKPSGRCGDIIYRDGEYEKVIPWEMSCDPGIALSIPLDLRTWDKPKGKVIPKVEQYRLLNELREWLKKKKTKSGIELPVVDNYSGKTCNWAGCDNPVLSDMVICADHFNESLLMQ